MPAAVSVAHCSLECEGDLEVHCDETSYVTLISRDGNGNRLVRGGLVFTAELQLSGTVEAIDDLTITDGCDGSYVLRFRMPQTSTTTDDDVCYKLIVKLDGTHVSGVSAASLMSPWSVGRQ